MEGVMDVTQSLGGEWCGPPHTVTQRGAPGLMFCTGLARGGCASVLSHGDCCMLVRLHACVAGVAFLRSWSSNLTLSVTDSTLSANNGSAGGMGPVKGGAGMFGGGRVGWGWWGGVRCGCTVAKRRLARHNAAPFVLLHPCDASKPRLHTHHTATPTLRCQAGRCCWPPAATTPTPGTRATAAGPPPTRTATRCTPGGWAPASGDTEEWGGAIRGAAP